MPIANCFVREDLPRPPDGERLIALWSAESGVGVERMTINVIADTRQSGAAYPVMAFLYLPSLWSAEEVRRLQEGLSSALSRGFAVAAAEVQVVTSIVESGHVVEDGHTQAW
jgi:hypothetical protein